MFRIFSTALILFLISPIGLAAQSDVKIKKSDFKEGKAGFKQAWDHVVAGDALYMRKGAYYNNALDHYIQALGYNSKNPELNYKTGISAIYTDNKEEAAGFFLKALEIKNEVADDILLYTGRALQYTGRYDEAVNKLTGYLKSKVRKTESNVTLAKRFIEECNSALSITKDTMRIEINNIGANINSESDDFSPVLTYDGMSIYFASKRKYKSKAGSSGDLRKDENIYFSQKSGGKWSIAAIAGDDLNSDYNEAPVYIDSAGTRLYVYSGFENGGDIKVAAIKKGEWKTPENIPFSLNSTGSETSLSFHPAGNEIYFVTNEGKDNRGGYDIYFITKSGDKKWSKPQNCGTGINTAWDEQSISFSKAGDTMRFSSKGHNSIGGFDIFYSVRNLDGTWGQAINGGYPLNTTWDELFHNAAPSSDTVFYFASNRSGGFGGLDIYMGKVLPELPAVIILDSLIKTDTIAVITLADSSITIPSMAAETELPLSESPEKQDNPDEIEKYFIRED